ncbi:MAG: hypothetical protein US95_C0001G0018 [Candidatus Woesebacteria bacterium GW2011_GWB1_38_5]|uniref:Uncharacterized protein n=1 Tax=Candidatus Woesebacteria bacterium GW2011_GWB1_38_5 TaxID=1618568 RepID=A0A0G0K9U8_9BACT|nr:MAG: hypothetical protein US97_C0053G0002 [Microgenomates group bacterium GW2011_GWF1_38_5]KKQ75587.1 MAG: hypothetical protein US95_C0001G0018 [Candidatus Woesebacteria bacterium GW2011_GWB1_38_5]
MMRCLSGTPDGCEAIFETLFGNPEFVEGGR